MIGSFMPPKHKRVFGMLYLCSFIISFHVFFVVYMTSSFLATFVDEKFVGFLYIVSNALSLISLVFVSRLLKLIGNYRTFLLMIILEFLAFLGFAFIDNAVAIIIIFVLQAVPFLIVAYNLDIFLESYTKEEGTTGRVRGIFLSAANIAIIFAPLISGFILVENEYGKIYFISALFLVPFFILALSFRNFEDPQYHPIRIKETFLCIKADKDLFNIFSAQFLMRFFFSWMVIYMPIYLHTWIGFSWSEIGLITAFILIPYALIEYPAGQLADNYMGEKELLALGFILTGVSTMMISLTTVPNILFWMGLLFLTRAGASLMEIMTESYFFKHVDATDNNTISFFRITSPLAYVLGPLVGILALLILDLRSIWIVLGAITLLGVVNALRIRDTR